VSYGLVYRYFKSKEAIFQALVKHLLQVGVDNNQNILEMPGTPGERLRLIISGVQQARREHPEYFQLFYQVLNDEEVSEDLREYVSRRGMVMYEVLRQLIIEGQATGEVAGGDPDQLVVAVMAYFDGLSRWSLRDPEYLKNHFPDTEIILRMLKP
jgi:AcrR family transcriptional regulator